jgi:hypothetical protein
MKNKVYCEDCIHRTNIVTCAEIVYNDILGKHYIKIDTRLKNKNNDCKDFEKKEKK